MGRDKAGIVLGGRPLLEWVYLSLSAVVGEVMVVGRREAGDLRAIPDAPAVGGGPAAGIATALMAAGGRPVLVVGVDQPWVRPATLAALLRVPRQPATPFDERYQVTCATYTAGDLSLLEETARRGGSLQSVVPRLGGTAVSPEQWRSWGEDGRSWFSVDTPQALSDGIRRYGVPDST